MYEPKKIHQVQLYLQSVIQADHGFPADNFQQQMKAFLEEAALERGSDALAVELRFNQKAILETRPDLKADTRPSCNSAPS